MEVAQREHVEAVVRRAEASGGRQVTAGWCPFSEPAPQEAVDRCVSWIQDVARAAGRTVVGRIIDGQAVGLDGKALT